MRCSPRSFISGREDGLEDRGQSPVSMAIFLWKSSENARACSMLQGAESRFLSCGNSFSRHDCFSVAARCRGRGTAVGRLARAQYRFGAPGAWIRSSSGTAICIVIEAEINDWMSVLECSPTCRPSASPV